jgi:hypothetical protein
LRGAAAGLAALFLVAAPAVAQPSSSPPSFSWGGVQVGAYAGSVTGGLLLETRVGYNVVRNRLVLGVDVGAGTFGAFGVVEARGRIGAVVRSNVLAYYSTGVTFIQLAGPYLTLGMGVEYGFRGDLSVVGEINVIHPLFVSPSPYFPTMLAGISWRPGR